MKYVFRYVQPSSCNFINLNVSHLGYVFWHEYLPGIPSWLNHFHRCEFGGGVYHRFSDSWFIECYFSSGYGVYDGGAGNLYTNCHIDNTGIFNPAVAALTLFCCTNTSITNC